MEQIQVIQNAPVFVRIDDVGTGDLPNLNRLVRVCRKTGIPVIIAVIPEKLSEETVGCLQAELNDSWAGLIIAQHGVSHVPHPNSVRKMEFDIFQAIDAVVDRLLEGRALIRDKLGLDAKWYVPPWNKYGRNLLRALEQAGYEALSAAKDIPFKSERLVSLPVNQDIVIDYRDGSIEANIRVWHENTKRNIENDGKAGLMLHHHLMQEEHIKLFEKWAEIWREVC